MSIVVGEITYTNILPLFFYLDRESLKRLGFKFLPQTPSILNEEMSAGNIQIGAISSFSYGEHFNNYSIFPDLSVSSTKAVRSIYLFSKVPLKKLNEKNVALTASSATSVNLLKIILQLFYNLDAIYTVMIPNISTMMEQQDACLLIGDDAIVAYRQYSRKYYCYDLGALWYRHTGFPMTYAVLAIRNEILNTKQSVVQILYDQLMMSKKKEY
ncbi:MAG: menaquinone biosynthesis protein [Bacillaceae bacterium]|nr:menaquinone biosynthesis protein [Bacillaceae bacterium]